MPCYIEHRKEPSRKNYQYWLKIGYPGTYEDYLARPSHHDVGAMIIVCGDLGPHCTDCSRVGAFLCDYPVGDGKTCDRSICEDHAHEIGIELHYCDAHYPMWREFKDAGGVDEALSNVIAFRGEK